MGENMRTASLKKKIQDMPIKRSIVLFVVVALLLATAASILTIVSTYSIRTEQLDLGNYGLVDTINGLLYLFIFVYIIGFIVAAVYLLYHIKLREPIKQLTNGTAQIAKNNLDFTMDYSSKDELGQVCSSFEKMKSELYQSNAAMWMAAEERKKLNAVFAHDLRTPLTVLKGYADFMEEYIPSGQMNVDKLLQTTNMMGTHIERIEHYVNMMSDLQRLEDTPVLPKPVSGKSINELSQAIAGNLEKQTGIPITFQTAMYADTPNIDIEIFQRVLENLLSNAARFAKSRIGISIDYGNGYLLLAVADDGNGFTSEYLGRPFTPFYQEDKPEHFGLGLNICRTLCRNHGGQIEIGNEPNGGAKVLATFKIR